MIIIESVTSQRALEQAARVIVDDLERKLERALHTKPFNPNNLAVNTKDLRIHTDEDEFNELLKAGIIAYLKLDNASPTTLGVWNGALHDPTANEAGHLELVVNLTGITSVDQIMPKFRVQKESIISTAIHELQHAYDNWRSGDIEDFSTSDADGTYDHSGRKRAYIDKDFINHAKSGHRATHAEYQNYSHEINARYAQAIADTKKKFHSSPMTGEAWMNQFKKNFVGWDDISDAEKKRLISRAGAEHSETKRKFNGKPSDLKRALRGFDVDYVLDSKYGKIGFWFSHFEYSGNRGEELVEELELLALKTSGLVCLPKEAIRDNASLMDAVKNGMHLGTWDAMGRDHVIYRS
ncbi:hypothetical protein VPHK567_0137 [Vibrio phage K567]